MYVRIQDFSRPICVDTPISTKPPTDHSIEWSLPTGGMRLGSPLQQNIIINNSKIFGNVFWCLNFLVIFWWGELPESTNELFIVLWCYVFGPSSFFNKAVFLGLGDGGECGFWKHHFSATKNQRLLLGERCHRNPKITHPFLRLFPWQTQVINGNNAASIHSDFVGNSIRDLSVSAGDTAWKHEVFMPIGVLAGPQGRWRL